MTEKKNLYRIALSLIPGVGSVLARNLVAYVGSVEGVFSESFRSLVKIPGIGEMSARSIKNKGIFERAEKELRFIEKYGITLHFFTGKNYPRRLKRCIDAPIILYSKGNMNLNEQRVISIVGTRNASSYGKTVCDELIRGVSERNYPVIVVSGLAYGIDIHAHRSAMKYSIPTVGVVGHGLDKIYPSLHAETARKMLQNGGLVSDFPSETKIDPPNFVRRNRIIAGLADATIVVESAEKGGSLITADIASSYNRDVFAFPGRANDTYSRGCNRLIRLNGASLIQDLDDLEYFMGWDAEKTTAGVQSSLFVDLNPEEKRVVDLLQAKGELYIDEISGELGMPTSKVSALLLKMEFNNLLTTLPGKRYQLK